MINIALGGRTGNNLFQYAVGRALAHRRNSSLVLDGSWVNASHEGSFREILQLPLAATYSNSGRLVKQLLRAARLDPARFHHGIVYDEHTHVFDPSVLDLPDGSLLRGFFQNYRYFLEIEKTIRAELDLSHVQLSKMSLDLETNLRSKISVSIHVRRGDYLCIPSTQCIAPDYYARAIQHFRDQYTDIRFCVFSDDIDWCRGQFVGPDFIFCDLPASRANQLHDLRLMAACQHHIIVNSSYSWWGAWLNPSREKQVIAPKLWMSGLPSTEIAQSNWIFK